RVRRSDCGVLDGDSVGPGLWLPARSDRRSSLCDQPLAAHCLMIPVARRLIAVALPTALLTSYFVVPFLTHTAYIDVSPYLASWKYNSYGAEKILWWLVRGELLDFGRIPVLTVLLGLGIIAAIRRRSEMAAIALSLFLVWLLLYFGRPTWGSLIDLLP